LATSSVIFSFCSVCLGFAFFTAGSTCLGFGGEGKAGVVVTFLAILELSKAELIEILQAEPFGELRVRAKSANIA
jgi:chromatin segregation and condensation protein Rec8/ScpA/Scc1 (kleisin family)